MFNGPAFSDSGLLLIHLAVISNANM